MARPRKYTLNENYFEEIDSSNKSYILGFIYADGSINKQKNSLTICLSEKDKDVLKNYRVADEDDEWFHEQWKNKLSGLKEAGDGKVRKNL